MLTPVVKSRRVDLSNNTLRSIGGIRRLGSVVWLKCSGNKLGPSLLALAGMSALRVLDVAANALDSLEGLGRSPPDTLPSLYYTPLHASTRLYTPIYVSFLCVLRLLYGIWHRTSFSTASRSFATCCRRMLRLVSHTHATSRFTHAC
jgi:Leucine-rich repeat (LRR) protein